MYSPSKDGLVERPVNADNLTREGARFSTVKVFEVLDISTSDIDTTTRRLAFGRGQETRQTL